MVDIDRRIASLGAPDDLIAVALGGAAPLDAEVMNRIHARVRRAVGSSGHRVARRQRALAATALACALAVALLSPASTLAWVSNILRFVPGFGLRPQSGVALALAKPVAAERDGVTVRVSGVLATRSTTTVSYSFTGGWTNLADAVLRVAPGVTYRPLHVTQGSAGYGAVTTGTVGSQMVEYAQLTFRALPAGDHQATLVVTMPSWVPLATLAVPVALVPATGLATAHVFSRPVRRDGVALAARVEQQGSRSLVEVLVRVLPAHTYFTAFGSFLHPLALRLPDGQREALADQPTTTATQLALRGPALPAGLTHATVIVPSIELAIRPKAHASILDLPMAGQRTVSIPIRLGPVRMRVVQIVRLDASKVRLTLAYNGPFELEQDAPLVDGRVPASTRVGVNRYWGIISITTAVPNGATRVSLGFASPVWVVVPGPWKIPVTVSRVTQGKA